MSHRSKLRIFQGASIGARRMATACLNDLSLLLSAWSVTTSPSTMNYSPDKKRPTADFVSEIWREPDELQAVLPRC
jgi:hypothetical protein